MGLKPFLKGGVYVSSHIGSMYGIYANIWGIWMVNVTIYSIHGSYGLLSISCLTCFLKRHCSSISEWQAMPLETLEAKNFPAKATKATINHEQMRLIFEW